MKYERILALLKCLLGAYVITGLLLLLTAGLLYKCNLSEKVIDIAIIAIYVISSLLAGLFYSKGAKSRRFLSFRFVPVESFLPRLQLPTREISGT